ncbi:MAG: glycoside hydrolase family 3 N-terminal domain-containing protein [Chlamydiales bacterium]
MDKWKNLLTALCVVFAIAIEAANTIYDNQNAAAAALVANLTLPQKIGQMLLPANNALTANYAPGGLAGAQAAWAAADNVPSFTLGDALGFQAITTYNIGAILTAGGPIEYSGSLPEDQRLVQWQCLADTLQLYAATTTPDLPLLLGTDAVHGNQHVVGSVLFPQNIGLGATHDPNLINLVGAWTAYNVKTSHWNWAYAPTLAVGHDYRWGRFYESFTSNADVMQVLAQYYIAGLQGITNGTTGQILGVLGTAKHFLADGNTQAGYDEGFSYAPDLNTVWAQNGAGYQGAVSQTVFAPAVGTVAEVGSAMASYSSLNGVPMHFGGDFNILSQFRNTGITYQNETYQLSGFVVSDYDGIARAAWKYNTLHGNTLSLAEAMAMSVNAGVDMIMMSQSAYTNYIDPGTFIPPTFQNLSPPYYLNLADVVNAITTAVSTGLISQARIDDAVTRILRTKLAMNSAVPATPPGASEADVALQAASESLVLLKNGAVIPVTAGNTEFVFLMGDYNDVGVQNGGWSVNWQGQKGNYYWTGLDKTTSNATTILDGINNTALAPEAQIITGETAVLNYPLGGMGGPTGANSIAVIAISEFPYAEVMGDVENQSPLYKQGAVQGFNAYAPLVQNCDLSLMFTAQQIQAIQYLQNGGIPVITVAFSGRPIVVTGTSTSPLTLSNAFIAAFLPGTSGGQAIADLIFGAFTTKSVSNVINGSTYYSNTLPFAWPASMAEVIEETPTLFPAGYGL